MLKKDGRAYIPILVGGVCSILVSLGILSIHDGLILTSGELGQKISELSKDGGDVAGYGVLIYSWACLFGILGAAFLRLAMIGQIFLGGLSILLAVLAGIAYKPMKKTAYIVLILCSFISLGILAFIYLSFFVDYGMPLIAGVMFGILTISILLASYNLFRNRKKAAGRGQDETGTDLYRN